jgi:glucosylglycerate synthase
MASIQTNIDLGSAAAAPTGSLLISLAPLTPEALETTLSNLSLAFANQTVLVATPDAAPNLSHGGPLRLLPYTSTTAASTTPWVPTAIDYVNAYKLVQENKASACLLLGAESQTLHPEAIQALAAATSSSDLAVARYNLGPNEGLVNSAILYPVTRALFAARPRFPLAIDLGLSVRMAQRLATDAQRFATSNQSDALIWPVASAASASFTITEIDAGIRTLPQPVASDFNSLLVQITGSLFTDVEAKASFWQRARTSQTGRTITQTNEPQEHPADVSSMLGAFQIAYTNLHEIWSLVLPPNSLLGLKRLSAMPPASFRMADNLWVRIVYDFILAYRLRTINRGHLLGALTPLYLAWVASHLLLISSGTAPEKHIEELAVAFEADKPYFVSRWRWPDRFNP